MRRKDRDLGAQAALQILDECEYATISCVYNLQGSLRAQIPIFSSHFALQILNFKRKLKRVLV